MKQCDLISIKNNFLNKLENKALEFGLESRYSRWLTEKNDKLFLSMIDKNNLFIECGFVNLKTGEYKILKNENSKNYDLLKDEYV